LSIGVMAEIKYPRSSTKAQIASPECAQQVSGAHYHRQMMPSQSAEQRREQLVEVFNEASVCEKCALSKTRTRVVFGSGNSDADLMFVGEAPGAEEDRQGLPFVGRAGGLLTQLIEGIGLSRDEVFITNVLMCRPPGNRDPQPVEIESCEPYLFEKVRLIEPRVVCTLGNFATKLLTGSRTGISKVRGMPQVHDLGGRTVFLMPLFHPAAALRTPSVEETLRSDFARLPELLEQPLPQAEPLAESEPATELGAWEADQLGLFG
jgi:uracil-DNA glycosylase